MVLPLLCQSHGSSLGMAAAPGFKSQCPSSPAAPFPTPPTISYTCQHSCILPALLGSHGKSGWAWPHGMESIISKLSHRRCNQGELLPSYILGGSHSHLPGSKHRPQLFNISMKPIKGYRLLNDHSKSYLQNCCYSKQLSMVLLYASHPPAQTCGVEDILYIRIFF